MPKLPQVTRGFIARSKQHVIEVKVSVYNLGFFITLYGDGELKEHTSRTGDRAIKHTESFVAKVRACYNPNIWTFEEKVPHKVKTDKDGFYVSSL